MSRAGAPESPPPAAGPSALDARRLLAAFPTGLVVVTAVHEDGPVGMTFQSFAWLSLHPPLVLLCPAVSSTSWPKIASAAGMGVNVLADGQGLLARQFAAPGGDRYGGVAWTPSPVSGAPILAGSLAWMDCRIEDWKQVADHLVVVCSVQAGDSGAAAEPLVYVRNEFRSLAPEGAE